MIVLKRKLFKHGSPSDKQAKAIENALKQAEFIVNGSIE